MTEDEVLATLRLTQRSSVDNYWICDERLMQFDDPARDVLLWVQEAWSGSTKTAVDSLNRVFDISTKPAQWEALFAFRSSATVRDVCHFIAQHARVPAIEMVDVFGHRCLAAGTFQYCRDVLIKNGEFPDRIAPSTSAANVYPRAMFALIHALARAAPEIVPHYLPRTTAQERMLLPAAAASFILALILIALGFVLASPIVMFIGMVCVLITDGIQRASQSESEPPSSLYFPAPYTLKDLARGWAEIERRRIQTTE